VLWLNRIVDSKPDYSCFCYSYPNWSSGCWRQKAVRRRPKTRYAPLLWHTSSQTLNQISSHRLTHYQNIIQYTTLRTGCI